MISNATAIRKRAERRLGELMEADRKAGKLKRGGARKGSRVASGPLISLADQGVDKHLADRARKAAAMPEAKFEAQVARAVKVAVAATEGDAAVVKEARKAQLEKKRARRAEREREFVSKILALPRQNYGVVLCDDQNGTMSRGQRSGMDRHASQSLRTASDAHTAVEIIERTKVRFECAADDCVLWMWTPEPFTRCRDGFLRLRGFKYKTTIMWDKMIPGTGHWVD